MNGTARSLRWSIAGAIALATVGAIAAWYGNHLHAEATLAHAQAQARAIEAQQRLGRAHAERRDIDAYLERYANLRTLGAIDNENRLDWIERIAAIRAELRSARLTYNVEPRQAYARLAPPGAGLRFEASPMRLEFAALHEGDLLRIIERLRTPAMGVFEVRGCSLAREGNAGGDSNAGTTSLAGTCQFDWISLVGATPPAPEAGGPR